MLDFKLYIQIEPHGPVDAVFISSYLLVKPHLIQFNSNVVFSQLRWYNEGALQIYCPKMRFESFPMDTQKCELKITSTGLFDTIIKFNGIFNYNNKKQRPTSYKVRFSFTPRA